MAEREPITLAGVIERVRNEPVVVVDFVKALLFLATAFGATISEPQVGAIVGFVWAALTFVSRQSVTPMRRVNTAQEAPAPRQV